VCSSDCLVASAVLTVSSNRMPSMMSCQGCLALTIWGP
jgi:hypothetical protein